MSDSSSELNEKLHIEKKFKCAVSMWLVCNYGMFGSLPHLFWPGYMENENLA